MFLGSIYQPRRARRRWVRALLFVLAALALDYILTIAAHPPSARNRPSAAPTPPAGHQLMRKERIFIASIHWNNEAIIRSHWAAAVVDLVRHLGAENVYVSIVENGSWDDTKGALSDLDFLLGAMGVERSVVMHETTHEEEAERIPGPDESGWLWTSRGRRELRRIPYLAGIRNEAMEPLRRLAERRDGKERRSFDKILWLNDVIFTTEDVTTLLATRQGDYAAACSLDFSRPPHYYDTFALRDISGAEAITPTWPFFLAAESRNAMLSHSPVPVKSCWNGIVVFQADPFYDDAPPRFRGAPDSLASHHLEGSECCLIHADNWLSSELGVWLNPDVRVAYSIEASRRVHAESGPWPPLGERLVGIWSNRLVRWTGLPRRIAERLVVDRRIRNWLREAPQKRRVDRQEIGEHCMVNEMQVLVYNGWAHV